MRGFCCLILLLCLFEPLRSQQQWVRKLEGHTYSVTFNPQNPSTAYAGVSDTTAHRLYVSHDEGEHWDSVWATPTLIPVVAIHPLDTLLMFIGTLYASSSAIHGLWRSTNGGDDWSQVIDTIGFIGESIVFDHSSPNRMFIGCNMPGGFYTSTDFGATWTLSPGTDSTEFCTVAQRKDSANVLYAGSFEGHILKSTDAGVSWRRVVEGPGAAEVPIIVVDPQNALVAYATHYGASQGISKTTDGGEQWFSAGLDSVGMWSLDIDPNNPSTLLAGEFDPGELGRMFRSTDAGLTWHDFSSGLPQSRITHWTVKIVSMETPLVLAAVAGSGGGGVYKLEPMVVSVPEQNDQPTTTFTLSQNYPNPFNPLTVIEYQVPTDSWASLKVYDLLGQHIATLFNGRIQAGNRQITWDAEGVSSGTYIYRLEAFSRDGTRLIQHRRMILIK